MMKGSEPNQTWWLLAFRRWNDGFVSGSDRTPKNGIKIHQFSTSIFFL